MHQPGAERQRLIWVINAACPSRCVYCGIDSQRTARELDEQEAVRAARAVVDAGFGEVVFVGGEPLLYRHLPAVLRELSGKCQVAVFCGGLPGEAKRWVDVLRHGATRLVLSLDDADEDRNDLVRGKRGVSRELRALADEVRSSLPELELSVSTVVTRHNVSTLGSSWPRIGELEPTAWVAVLAGDNFVETPSAHFPSLDQLSQLYLEDAPALARRVKREAPDTDFLLFPVPLPFLQRDLPVAKWDVAPSELGPAVAAELSRYAIGDYNASFVERFGCPLVGRDATLGVDGAVYGCSQAPIIRPEHVIGSVLESDLGDVLESQRLLSFQRAVPHAPCRRCWAPSNVPAGLLAALLRGRDG